MREGCGSTEPGVCSFVLGSYPQRGRQCPPSPPGVRAWDGIRPIGVNALVVFVQRVECLMGGMYPLGAFHTAF